MHANPISPSDIVFGSVWLPDNAFVDSFESCDYPNEKFKHPDHLRLGWIYIKRYDYLRAELAMRESVYRFASSLGAARKYNATLTAGWMRLIGAAVGMTPQVCDFHEFIEAHRWLLNRKALLAFYSTDLLFSEVAKTMWTEPDLRPLPAMTL